MRPDKRRITTEPLYLCDYEGMLRTLPDFWAVQRFVPIVATPNHQTLPYDPATTEIQVLDYLATTQLHVGTHRDWYSSFWVDNQFDKCCLVPWGDEAKVKNLCRFLMYLAVHGPGYGMKGLLLDLEYYTASGGGTRPMDPNHIPEPWPFTNLAVIGNNSERIGLALGDLQFGGYVATKELERFRALRVFLRTVSERTGKPAWVLGEDFTGWNAPVNVPNLVYVPGFQYKDRSQARERSHAWVWDQHKTLWRLL